MTNIANTANNKTSPDAVTEFEVRIRILNSSYQDLLEKEDLVSPFRPGMTASVDVTTEVKEDILTIPLAAVTTRNPNEKKSEDEEGSEEESENQDENASQSSKDNKEDVVEVVFLYNEGVAKMVEVETGISDFDNIEILSGVAKGDKIIKVPFIAVSKRLKDGDLVKEIGGDDKKSSEEEPEAED